MYLSSRVVALVAMDAVRRARQPVPSLSGFAAQWDGAFYLEIVRNGYPSSLAVLPDGKVGVSVHAFFPGYPLVVRAADAVLPGREFAAALLVSFFAGAVAVLALHAATRAWFDDGAADRAVLLFCFFPGALFLSWIYAEALVVALLSGSLALLARQRWLPAAALAGVATATRPNALPIVVACAWVAYEAGGPVRARVARAGGAALLAASGFIAFMVFLARRTGEGFAWFRVEREGFGEGTPWHRLSHVIVTHSDSGSDYVRIATLAFVALAVAGAVVTVRSSLPMWAQVMTLLALYLAVTANIAPASTRLQLAALPMFAAAGARLRGTALTIVIGCFGAGTVLLALAYGLPHPQFGYAP